MKNENKQQKIYRVLKERIIEREYAPGQRIVIDQIAKEQHTSIIPVREAIRQLEAEKLVFYQRNIGPVVAEVNESDYSDTLRVLAILEGYVAQMLPKPFPKDKIILLKKQNKAMKEALEEFDIIGFSKLNAQFHQIICKQCTNKYLLQLIKDTWSRISAIRGIGSTLYSFRVKESIEEHEQIIAMLEDDKDATELERMLREHKMRTVADFERRRLKQGAKA